MTSGQEKQERGQAGKKGPAILPFTPNRVLRLYLGGYGIDKLCGITPAKNTRFPENWIASVIEGNGRAYHSPGHGISKILVDGSPVDFPGFLKEHAEMMLGRGDMLFIPPGCSDLERIQGAMVDDKDIKEIVAFVSKQRPQSFDRQVIAEEEALDDESADIPDHAPKAEYSGEHYDDEDGEDTFPTDVSPIVAKYMKPGDNELMAQALEIIITEHKVSTSYLQRRLTIGYNTAAKLIDELEERGVVSGPLPGGSKREILITDGIEVQQQP